MKVWVVLCFSALIFPSANGHFQNNYSQHESTKQMWKKIILHQKETDQIIAITDNPEYLLTNEVSVTYTNIKKDVFNEETMETIYRSMVKAQRRPLYLIDGMASEFTDTQILIKTIRSYDKVSYIIVAARKIGGKAMNNVYFMVPQYNKEFWSVHGTCLYCDHGKDVHQIENVLSNRNGFNQDFKLSSSFKGSLFGAELKVGYVTRFGVIYPIGVDRSGSIIFAGYTYHMLKIIAECMKVDLKFIKSPDGKYGGVVNGVPQGLLGMVYDGIVDIGAENLLATKQRYEYVDFSVAFHISKSVVITNQPKQGINQSSFFTAFGIYVWISLLICIPVSGTTLYVISRFSKDEKKENEPNSVWECIWHLFQIIMWDSNCIKPKDTATIVLVLPFMVVTFVLVTEYFGIVTALITIQPYLTQPIETIEDFLESDLRWIGIEGYGTTQDFLTDPKMADRYAPVRDVTDNIGGIRDALEMLVDDPYKYCFPYSEGIVTSAVDFYFTDMNGNHQFHFGKGSFGSSISVFFLPKSSDFATAFDRRLLRMVQAGIVRRLLKQTVHLVQSLGRREAKKHNRMFPVGSDMIQLKHLKGCFMVLGIMLALSGVVFLGEIVCHSLPRWFPNLFSSNAVVVLKEEETTGGEKKKSQSHQMNL